MKLRVGGAIFFPVPSQGVKFEDVRRIMLLNNIGIVSSNKLEEKFGSSH